jgi:hypothetical protein
MRRDPVVARRLRAGAVFATALLDLHRSAKIEEATMALWRGILGALTVAAGTAGGAVGVQASVTPVEPILVVLGGYGTCRGVAPDQTMLPEIGIRARAELADRYGLATHTIYSCYGIGTAAESSRISFQLDDGPVIESTVAVFLATAQAQLERWNYRSNDLVIVGQSHGGWTAGKLVERLAAATGGRERVVDLLVTLDPISYEQCQTADIKSAASVAGFSGVAFGPCTTAPMDLSPGTIARATERWLNYYQTQCAFLHSGPMPGAHNARIDVDVPADRDLTYMREILAAQVPGLMDQFGDIVMEVARQYLQQRPEMNAYYHIDIVQPLWDSMSDEIDHAVAADLAL